MRALRLMAVLVVMALLSAACGQKDGVRQVAVEGDGRGDAGGAVDLDDGLGDDLDLGSEGGDFDVDLGDGGGNGGGGPAADPVGTGGSDQPAPDPGGNGGGQDPAEAAGGEGSGGNGGGAGNDGGGGEAPARAAGGGDTTGVTDSVIKIGFHAPLTGAAPVPIDSIRTGSRLYWQNNRIAGRQVEVVIRDDQYNPSRATQVCRELIEREKVWILFGGAGADGIAACARVAAKAGVPYASLGVDEGPLRQLPGYFTLSMSYVQQAPLLVQWIQKHARPSNNRVAIVRDRTPSFNNALRRFHQLAEEAGFEVLVRQSQNGPSDAQWLAGNDIEVAYPLMAPNDWLQILQSPGGDVDWVGVGLTMGLNLVAQPACRTARGAFEGSMMLSPFPGLNQAPKLAPGVNFRDDLEFALWGASETLHQVARAMGDDLSRQNFVRTFESRAFEPKVFNPIRHRPGDHFGSQGMHVLLADCDRGQWVTPDSLLFRRGF